MQKKNKINQYNADGQRHGWWEMTVEDFKNNYKKTIWVAILKAHVCRGKYKSGVLHGIWEFIDDRNLNESKIAKINFQEGIIKWTEEYVNDVLSGKIIYKNHPKNSRIVKRYYKNGNVKLEFSLWSYHRYGTLKRYYESGKLKCKKKLSTGKFINGNPDGNWVFYSEKGEVLYCGKFENGKEEGVWKYRGYISRMSHVNQEISYKKGKKHGIFKSYKKNGKLFLVEFFDNDQRLPFVILYPSKKIFEWKNVDFLSKTAAIKLYNYKGILQQDYCSKNEDDFFKNIFNTLMDNRKNSLGVIKDGVVECYDYKKQNLVGYIFYAKTK